MPASGQTTPPRTSRLVQLLPWLVLLTGMALSLWTWDALRQGAIKEAQIRFQFRAQQVETSLRERLHSNRLALQGGAALFAASDQVSRAEWRTYVSALGLADNYPGLQSMGYVLRIPRAERTNVIRQLRAEGLQGFDLPPAGARDEYAAVIYLEPAGGITGHDLYDDPALRRTMERARDSGQPAMTGRITLADAASANRRAGFAIYLPAYRNGLPVDTIAQRRAALVGWVHATFRMDDFMAGLTSLHSALGNDMALTIFHDDGALLWDSGAGRPGSPSPADGLATRASLASQGYPWSLRMTTLPAFADSLHEREPFFTLLFGCSTSLLAMALTMALIRTQTRAVQLARQMTAALEVSEERYRQMFMTNRAIKLLTDPVDMRIVDANPAAVAYYGYSMAQLLSMKISDINTLSPEAIAREMALAQEEKRLNFNFRHRLASGEVRDVEVYSGPVAHGGRTMIYSIIHDVTERNRIQAEQRAIIETAIIGLAHVRERRLVWANVGLVQMFGYPPEAMPGMETARLYASDAAYEQIGRDGYSHLSRGESYEIDALMRRHDGTTFWCSVSGRMIDADQPELGSIWTLNDIDDRVRAREELAALNAQLRELSTHDPLTGLANRRHLDEVLRHEILLARRKRRQLAAVMLDIDLFKRFNDRHGHDAGDAVLRQVAELLARHVRATDTACRYGGEEFLILMPETDHATAVERAESIRRTTEAMRLDFHGEDLGGVTLSLGVAVYPDHADDGEALISRADAALYRAKEGGRNRVESAS
ncbi:MAG: diguanylate cyclase [Gallionellaceae bacterium]|nr:diguanylate cyclase [Gallionellaceae bacterium]